MSKKFDCSYEAVGRYARSYSSNEHKNTNSKVHVNTDNAYRMGFFSGAEWYHHKTQALLQQVASLKKEINRLKK